MIVTGLLFVFMLELEFEDPATSMVDSKKQRLKLVMWERN